MTAKGMCRAIRSSRTRARGCPRRPPHARRAPRGIRGAGNQAEGARSRPGTRRCAGTTPCRAGERSGRLQPVSLLREVEQWNPRFRHALQCASWVGGQTSVRHLQHAEVHGRAPRSLSSRADPARGARTPGGSPGPTAYGRRSGPHGRCHQRQTLSAPRRRCRTSSRSDRPPEEDSEARSPRYPRGSALLP